MDINDIIKLMEAMKASEIDLVELPLEEGKLKLKRHPVNANIWTPPAAVAVATDSAVSTEASEAADTEETLTGSIVTAPVVGIFFAAPSPEAKAFAELGDTVATGDILCIIEAMKLMNEVASTSSGKILEIYAKNGQKVQYGDPLFRIG